MRKLLPLLLAIAACGNVPNGLGGGGGGDGGGGNGDSGGGGGDGGNRGGNDAGGSGSGSGSGITTTGLTFGIVGDTRPSSETTGTSGYPTTIINTIFQDLENASPKPSFVIATGDYEFIYPPGSEDSGPGPGYGASDGCTCNTAMSDGGPSVSSGQCGQQCLYWKARSEYSGPFWPAMGNHECTGADVSNCAYGKGTLNLADWIGVMLTPIGETSPYYSKTVTASDNSWTAKFIITACNAWDSTQASWLTAQLAQSTTYTFVIRHESAEDINSGDSGSSYPCKASQTAIDGATMTLLVVGHTHEYAHYASSKEIVNGLGGAPLTSGDNYGYTVVNRNSDGTLTVTTYDYMGGSTLDSFKINADGSPAP